MFERRKFINYLIKSIRNSPDWKIKGKSRGSRPNRVPDWIFITDELEIEPHYLESGRVYLEMKFPISQNIVSKKLSKVFVQRFFKNSNVSPYKFLNDYIKNDRAVIKFKCSDIFKCRAWLQENCKSGYNIIVDEDDRDSAIEIQVYFVNRKESMLFKLAMCNV